MSNKITVNCTKCGAPREFTTEEIRQEQKYVCSGCGVHITLDPTKLNKGIEDTKKEILKSFQKSFGKNFKLK